jgi:hypothetical protein
MSDHNAVGKAPGIVPLWRLNQKISGKSNASAYTKGPNKKQIHFNLKGEEGDMD